MKITILGAGQVGGSVARHLSSEGSNRITLVDIRDEPLQILREQLDIRTIQGHATHPSVLKQAGMEKADLLLALTSNDVMSELRRLEKPLKRIILAGAGNIGRRLALALEKDFQLNNHRLKPVVV